MPLQFIKVASIMLLLLQSTLLVQAEDLPTECKQLNLALPDLIANCPKADATAALIFATCDNVENQAISACYRASAPCVKDCCDRGLCTNKQLRARDSDPLSCTEACDVSLQACFVAPQATGCLCARDAYMQCNEDFLQNCNIAKLIGDTCTQLGLITGFPGAFCPFQVGDIPEAVGALGTLLSGIVTYFTASDHHNTAFVESISEALVPLFISAGIEVANYFDGMLNRDALSASLTEVIGTETIGICTILGAVALATFVCSTGIEGYNRVNNCPAFRKRSTLTLTAPHQTRKLSSSLSLQRRSSNLCTDALAYLPQSLCDFDSSSLSTACASLESNFAMFTAAGVDLTSVAQACDSAGVASAKEVIPLLCNLRNTLISLEATCDGTGAVRPSARARRAFRAREMQIKERYGDAW